MATNNYGTRSSSGVVWPRKAVKRRPPLTQLQAARLLSQATFGATYNDIVETTGKGVDQWFAEQKSITPSLMWDSMVNSYTAEIGNFKIIVSDFGFLQIMNPNLPPDVDNIRSVYSTPYKKYEYCVGTPDVNSNRFARTTIDHWTHLAVSAPDQLRQRMAYELSQIFVVSQSNDTLFPRNDAIAFFYDCLIKYGLDNFRDLLEAVTLSPGMGLYLNMFGSTRADPALGVHADENYAREIMQLFTIGLTMLDETTGEQVVDPNTGEYIDTYKQIHVEELAKKFTGWKSKPGSSRRDRTSGAIIDTQVRDIENYSSMVSAWNNDWNMIAFMEPYPRFHDPNCARILGVSGYGSTAEKIAGTDHYKNDTVIPGLFTPYSQRPSSGLINQDLYFDYANNTLWQYQNGWNVVVPLDGDLYTDGTTGIIYQVQSGVLTASSNVYEPMGLTKLQFDSLAPVAKKQVYQNYVLKLILDTLFNHPNTPLFICKQLIQRFITSNPTRDYLGRVVATFKNNGYGVRGDLFAVIKAILTDREAIYSIGYGKAKEPVMRFTHFWREFNGRDNVYSSWYFSKTIRSADVNLTNYRITLTKHGFSDHQPVIYTSGGGSGIGNLTDGAKYFVVYIDENTIQLSKFSGGNQVIQLTSKGNDLQKLIPVSFLKSSFSDRFWSATGQLPNYLGEQPLYAPTVFNFYPPDYSNALLRKNTADPNFVAPEFGIINENTVVSGRNFLNQFVYKYADSKLVSPGFDGLHQSTTVNYAYDTQPFLGKYISNTGTVTCTANGSLQSLFGSTTECDMVAISGSNAGGASITGYNPALGGVYLIKHNNKITVPTSSVDFINNTITITNHGLTTGDRVVYCANEGYSIEYDDGGGKLGIDESPTRGIEYFVKVVDVDNIRLARYAFEAYDGPWLIFSYYGNNTQFFETGRNVDQFQLLTIDRQPVTATPGDLTGQRLLNNEEFATIQGSSDTMGSINFNTITRYTYTNNDGLLITRKSKNVSSILPSLVGVNSSGYALEIRHANTNPNNPTATGYVAPGYGGWQFALPVLGYAGETMVCKFTMWIPAGKYVHSGGNNMGTNGFRTWLTDNAGVSGWKEYAMWLKVGTFPSGTTPSSTTQFYFYITDSPNASAAALPPTATFYTWVAKATVYRGGMIFTRLRKTRYNMYPKTILANIAHWETLAATDTAALVNKLDLVFMSGQMSSSMRTYLTSYVNSIEPITDIRDPNLVPFVSYYTSYLGSYNYKAARIIEAVEIILSSAQWSILS